MARAGKGMGGGVAGNRAGPDGHQSPGGPGETDENTLAQDRMGDFKQQGHAKELLTNEREDQPDSRRETDGPLESARKLDKDARARSDLGKGARHSPEHPTNKDD